MCLYMHYKGYEDCLVDSSILLTTYRTVTALDISYNNYLNTKLEVIDIK